MRLILILFSLFLSLTLQSQILIFKYEHNIRYKAPKGLSWNDMINTNQYDQIDIDTIPKVCIIQLDMMMVFFIGGEFEITEVIEKEKYLHLKLLSYRDQRSCDFKILQSENRELFGVVYWENETSQLGYYLHPASFIDDKLDYNKY
jgi:hypothetical protein